MIMHFAGRTYSVRTIPSGALIGMFILDDTDAHVISAHGSDVTLTLRVAGAALDAGLLPF